MKLLLNPNLLDQYLTSFKLVLIDYTPKFIAAILLLFIGLWGIKFINKISYKIMVKREIEPTLIEFLTDTIYWGLRVLLFIIVISKLGIESSSFVAILGAAGLAIGLSLQGSLSNFAGGILIILFKPFKLGDSIEAQGAFGTVIDIQIFVTQILTASNEVVFVPNGILSNGKIINYSRIETRRTDLIITIPYDADIKKTRDQILTVVNSNDKVLENPKPTVVVKELAETGVKIAVRVWTKNEDFTNVSSAILEEYKESMKV